MDIGSAKGNQEFTNIPTGSIFGKRHLLYKHRILPTSLQAETSKMTVRKLHKTPYKYYKIR